MLGNRLTTKEYWCNVWSDIKLPVSRRLPRDFDEWLNRNICSDEIDTVFEIGCAPGGFLSYFHRTFGCNCVGLEYVPSAAEATVRNMQMQGIPSNIIVGDFFDYTPPERRYPLVFSAGFIEHFDDLKSTVKRICEASERYVVTLVPNMFGINGLISRSLRQEVYDAHRKINTQMLQSLHEDAGLRTLFCDYIGGPKLIRLVKGYQLSKGIRLMANSPVVLFNALSRSVCRGLDWYPRSSLFCSSMAYVGKISRGG